MGIVVPFPVRNEALMAKPLSWFRMWADAVDDEKLRLLAFEDRWHFVALLCLKARGILDEKNADLRWQKVCLKLGLDSAELERVMKRLETVGLVSCNAEKNFQPTAWNKRQFVSDSSTSRVRAFRKRNGNVSVTTQSQSTETEEEKNPAARAEISGSADSGLDPEAYLIWTAGIDLIGEKKRGLMGKLVKTHGAPAVANKLAELMAMAEKPRDPASYLVGALRKQERRFVC
jgi:hypothetical protein